MAAHITVWLTSSPSYVLCAPNLPMGLMKGVVLTTATRADV